MAEVTFKPGDRVSYMRGVHGVHPHGRTAVVLEILEFRTKVCWEDNKTISYPGNSHLELINMIDTTKPLFMRSSHEVRPVTFVTETSEGHLLVDVPATQTTHLSGWVIYDKQGKYVRSTDGTFAARTTLENELVKTVELHAMTPNGGISGTVFDNRNKLMDMFPTAVFILRVYKTNGVVTNVDAIKP